MSWVSVGTTVLGTAANYFGQKKAAGPVPLQPVDLQAEQKKAVEGNLSNEGSIEALLSRSNAFSQNQALSLMEKAMPGYTQLASKFTDTANNLLDNPYALPSDVQKNLERQAAERGISVGGGSGSNFQGFSLLRDLGINELNYGQSRINQAQGLFGVLGSVAPKVNPMSPLSFYVTPGQTAQIAAGENAANQEIAQSGVNAQTAAQNNRTQSLWDSIAFGAGVASKLGNGTSTTTAPAGTSTAPVGDFGLGYGSAAAGMA